MADRFFDTSAVAKHYRVAASEGLIVVNPDIP